MKHSNDDTTCGGRHHFPEAVFISCHTGKPRYTNQAWPRGLLTRAALLAAMPGHRQLPLRCLRSRAGVRTKPGTGINLVLVSWAFSARLLHQLCINYICYWTKHITRLILERICRTLLKPFGWRACTNQRGKEVLCALWETKPEKFCL